MPVPTWPSEVHPVRDGEQVKAEVTNRYPGELDQRTQYLKTLVDAIEEGSILIARDQPLEAATQVGHAVYLNTDTQVLTRALAAVEPDPSGKYIRVADSAHVVGIVYNKTSATLGDVLLLGRINDFDFSNAVDTPTVPGAYYLSATVPGKLVHQSPPVSVYVAYLDGQNGAFVQPTPKDMLEDHIHYRFELSTLEAQDETDKGWLPADNPIFGGLAPEGAVYGYNISQHPELRAVFPPIPPSHASIVRFVSEQSDRVALGNELICTGECSLVTVDYNGIWWMTDSEVPWGSGYTSSPNVGCSDIRMVLWFTRMTFKTDESVVTSLRPGTGSPIVFRDANGREAVRGALFAYLDMVFSEGESGNADCRGFAFKEIDGLLFKRGPVVSEIRSASDAINVSGTSSVVIGNTVYHHGTVTLDFAMDETAEREGFVQVVGMNNSRQVEYENVLYIGFPQGRESSVRLKIHLPSALPPNPLMYLELRVLGRVAGTLPDLTASYRRISDPGGCTTPLALPIADTDLPNISFSGCTLPGINYYISVETDRFSVAAKDLVYVTIGRSGSSDGYNGEVGLLEIRWRVVPTT